MKNINNVIEWAKDRGILTPNNANKQLTKVIEELGETSGAYLKREGKEVIDGVGDVFVTLIILSKQLDLESNLHRGLNAPCPILNTPNSYLFGIAKCIGDIGELINRDNSEYSGYNIFEAITLLNGFTKFIGHDLEYCLDVAYNEIKDRTGKTVDGIFVKN